MRNAGMGRGKFGPAVAALFAAGLISGGLISGGAEAQVQCPAERAQALVPADPEVCRQLEKVFREPSAQALPDFEKSLDRFFGNRSFHRHLDGGLCRWLRRRCGCGILRHIAGRISHIVWLVSHDGTSHVGYRV